MEIQEINMDVINTTMQLEVDMKKENNFIVFIKRHNKKYAILEAKFDSLQEKDTKVAVGMRFVERTL